MVDDFEIDPYPGRPRLLFVGIAQSTHTHSWIDLLDGAGINVRLFAMPYELVPSEKPIKTYLSVPSQEPPNNLHKYIDYPNLPQGINAGTYTKCLEKIVDSDNWLASIIQAWQPDIIHTLGLFDEQGGLFYYNTRKKYKLEGMGRWVLQLRGGSDIALRRHNPEIAKQILEIFNECDEIITDNYVNIKYIKELGLGYKVAAISPVPGTGGVDTDKNDALVFPSKKERIILWPKAYESPWSKALPVMEALELAWDRIKPCKIYMTASVPETETWFWTLSKELRENCTIVRRIPRDELLELMGKARVLLAPSLVDGVPNILYEAMINNTFPIVSPLDTIKPIVANETNVLFARNLYPSEICKTLIRAMSDDSLVDKAAVNNRKLVNEIASRKVISKKLTDYYYSLANYNHPLVTVITPTYNRAGYLPETIESVLSQSYPNIQFIVLDDGSKDDTLDVLMKYREKITIETHENIGETETVNQGFRMAMGEYICVVNSDDPLLPDAISTLILTLKSNPKALAAYPDWVEIDSNSNSIQELRLPDYHIENMLREFNVAMGPGTLFRRSVLKDYGFRDPKRKYTGDLEFWFRLATHGKLVHVSKVLATHRTHPDSTSINDKSSKMAEELISMVKSLFAAGNVPADIQYKKQVFSQVYYTATFYCPREPFKRIQYFILSFLYNPRRFLLKIYQSPKHYVRQSTVKFLRFVLPESTYSSIRSWWRRLRKINS